MNQYNFADEMEFEEYLKQRKIDSATFKNKFPDVFETFVKHFELMHPESFAAQKLFLINNIRRECPIKVESTAENKPQIVKAKPKITPRKI
jgi:hypothetical protein